MFSKDNTIEIKIIVIGFAEYFENIKKALLQFPNLSPTFVSIQSYEQLKIVLGKDSLPYEIILFTDKKLAQLFKEMSSHPYEYNVHNLHTNELSLLSHYNELSSKNPLQSFSLDFLTINIQNRFEQLTADTRIYSILLKDRCLDEVISFHEKNYMQEQSIILTSSPLVFKGLEELKIPALLAVSHYSEVMLTLERAVLSSSAREKRENQPVVFIFEFSDITSAELPLLKVELNQYKKILNGILYKINGSTYHLLTNFGTFENASHGYKKIHLLDSFHQEENITVKIGIGLGTSHAMSLYNAHLALNQSRSRKGDTCFIAREDKSIFGPIEPNQEPVYEKYSLSIKNSDFIQMANEFQMSAVYLSKLLGRLQADKKLTYTSDELATTLNVTTRSANRILLNWLDAKLISIIGEEKANTTGRPRRLYRFDFLKESLST